MTPLEVAEASPAAVGRQDLEAWTALFTDDGEVHDPIGGPRHPVDALPAFWRVFIQGNGIRFEIHRDLSCEGVVWRDVTIHTTFPLGATLKVPAHLRYDTVGDKVRRLHAHWELLPMVWQTTLAGPRAWLDSTRMSWRMLANWGPAGLLRYLGGAFGVGARGKAEAVRWSQGLVQVPTTLNGQPTLARRGLSKLLAAGQHVTASTPLGVAWLRFEAGKLHSVELIEG